MKRVSPKSKIITGIITLSILCINTSRAQEKISASFGGDFVSSYVWRGIKQAGASIQPSLNIGYKNFSLGSWASTDIASAGAKEVDFTASYENSGIKVAVTDYWWDGEGAFRYLSYPDDSYNGHYLETAISYTLGNSFPLSISWNTFVLGKGNKKTDGKNSYSTYIELGYPFTIGGLDMGISTGFTPWTSTVYNTDGFKFTSIQINSSKNIRVSDSISFPIWGSIIANPAHEDIHFVLGVSIK